MSIILDRRNLLGLDRECAAFHSRVHGALTSALGVWLTHGNLVNRPYYTFIDRWDDEEEFQINLLDVLYATTTIDFEAFHIPNGGLRSKATAVRMKRAGARAGVADLYCAWTAGGGGWLELKGKNGSLSFAQRQFGKWVTGNGGHWAVARTIAEALGLLIEWGAPVKRDFHGIAKLKLPR